ncbi:MAG TPA: FKBP-type peptidyl-prolyl cis-trans isomerase [Candidatus Pacearchaeota archaeon]|nr:FKBP-type peptidyl-prolyl cis-trans isomerase [Candidatus Pacearchaeota archaeon]
MSKTNLINVLLLVIFIGLMYFVFQFFSKVEIGEQGASIHQNFNEQENNLNDNSIEMQNNNIETEILKEGQGEPSKVNDTLVVHYTGILENGEKFDSSLDRGVPFEFTLGNHSVIEGWEQGMLNMKVGEKKKLFIPYQLGYGEYGYPPVIPEKANLIFEVELLEIK